MDFSCYGKSEGKINSEQQFIDDISLVYEKMKGKYQEENIIVLGLSLVTIPFAVIASEEPV